MKPSLYRCKANGFTCTQREFDDSGTVHAQVRARSQREADRAAKAFGWRSFDRGTGRQFGSLWFDGRYLRFHTGWDI